MSRSPWEFRSPAVLMEEIAERVPLREGHAYVALVSEPPEKQELVAITLLQAPAELDDWIDASEEIGLTMQGFGLPDRTGPPTHSALTVVVRRGLCVHGPNEGRWLKAWRYSNHLTAAFSGSVVLVTEHGWLDFMSDEAGCTPALASAGRARA